MMISILVLRLSDEKRDTTPAIRLQYSLARCKMRFVYDDITPELPTLRVKNDEICLAPCTRVLLRLPQGLLWSWKKWF